MPFVSAKQRRFLAWKKPKIYRKWVRKYGKNVGGGGSHKLKKKK